MKIRIPDWLVKYWIWLAAGGITAIYGIITRWGVIVGFDSYYYLASAQGILDGYGIGWIGADGVFVPLTHYPPLYPLLVALVSFITGTTVLQGARILMLLTVFCAVVSTGKLLQTLSTGWAFPSAGMLLFLVIAPLQITQISAMTESLFLALLCGFLHSLSQQYSKLWQRLLLGAGFISLMILVRFAAVAVLAAALVYLVSIREVALKRRFGYALVVGVAAMIPVGIWLWSRTTFGEVTGRTLLFHPPAETQYRLAWETIQAWFIPDWERFGVAIVAQIGLFLVFAILLLSWVRSVRNHPIISDRKPAPAWLPFLGIYLVVYPVFLWFSYTLMDASTRWTTRILSPWLFSLMLILLTGIHRFHKQKQPRWMQGVMLAGAILWIVASGISAIKQARDLVLDGDGLTSRTYQKSELLQQVRLMENELIIYTNSTPAIYFNTGKVAISIPEKKDTIQALPNENYSIQLEEMKAKVQSGKAILVIFRPYDDKNGVYPTIEELGAQLQEGYKSKEGIIFQ